MSVLSQRHILRVTVYSIKLIQRSVVHSCTQYDSIHETIKYINPTISQVFHAIKQHLNLSDWAIYLVSYTDDKNAERWCVCEKLKNHYEPIWRKISECTQFCS